MGPINLITAEKAIYELLDISKELTQLGISYKTQKPILDLSEKIYKKEILNESFFRWNL